MVPFPVSTKYRDLINHGCANAGIAKVSVSRTINYVDQNSYEERSTQNQKKGQLGQASQSRTTTNSFLQHSKRAALRLSTWKDVKDMFRPLMAGLS